jgi:D-glycero-D-manno-heptose 1,7-bisphosphate phosphatase
LNRTNRGVFLDRDGVINRAIVRNNKPYPPATIAELEILPGVPQALSRLHAAGYLLIVTTNQPDVARGTSQRETVEAMHHFLASQLPIDDFQVCYHDDKDGCLCRKPSPGSLLNAAEKFQIDLGASFMVGDRWRDIQAGQRAGCKTVFIDYHYAEPMTLVPDQVVASLQEAADWILAR